MNYNVKEVYLLDLPEYIDYRKITARQNKHTCVTVTGFIIGAIVILFSVFDYLYGGLELTYFITNVILSFIIVSFYDIIIINLFTVRKAREFFERTQSFTTTFKSIDGNLTVLTEKSRMTIKEENVSKCLESKLNYVLFTGTYDVFAVVPKRILTQKEIIYFNGLKDK